MKLFKCQSCGQVVYFENTHCERCQHRLGYLPSAATVFALEPTDNAWQPVGADKHSVRFCENASHDACNWLLPADSPDVFCAACRHNRTIPDLSVPENLSRWQRLEQAKHRLFYSLLRFQLPLRDRTEDPEHGLVFDFIGDGDAPSGPRVLTGHDNGVITIAVAEADDAERESRRTRMQEPYRTLLGHFRHEVGHYFWDVLIRDGGQLDACRAIFGDDSVDYDTALKTHYAQGAPANWQENFVSAYASCHPWEDWAETWAHYLHIVDTVEMASAFGIRVQPRITRDESMATDINIDPYQATTMQEIIDAWLPLTFAVNNLNRAMGNSDLYPFVLSPAVVAKLGFVHDVVSRRASDSATRSEPLRKAS